MTTLIFTTVDMTMIIMCGAFNDQMKTIPYTVQWNYFNPIVINDMKDIIYRMIID